MRSRDPRGWRRVVALGAVAVLVAALSACRATASDPQLERSVQQVRMQSATGQDELLLLPPVSATKVVLFMHGFDADQDQLLDDSGLFPLRDALLGAGYAVATSESHGDNAGNPQSLADQKNLLTDVKAKLTTVTQVNVVGFSMGGLDGLLAAHSAPDVIHSVVLLSPVTDQSAFLDGRYGGVIARAFAADTPQQVEQATAANNPSEKAAAGYRGPKYAFWHSPDDDVVPETQSLTMVDRLRGAGIDASFSELDGDHGDLSALPPASVVEFMGSR